MSTSPFVFTSCFEWLKQSAWSAYYTQIQQLIHQKLYKKPPGDMPTWCQALQALPTIAMHETLLNTDYVTLKTKQALSDVQHQTLFHSLFQLRPWRKGPFSFFDIKIDTEWQSNLKWDRIAPHLDDLTYRTVLDIGCGSGYHAWRLLGAGAKQVIGIDPSILFLSQFTAFKQYAGPELPIDFLPVKLDELPYAQAICETILSMGLLYHQKSPILHLEQLFSSLKPKGQLILETLVIEGGEQAMLVPSGRYAAMRNVWFIPSLEQLPIWLKRIGFQDITLINVTKTNCEEQRSTLWMPFHSLENYLNPTDPTQTIEGYPAPLRAVWKARKPKN